MYHLNDAFEANQAPQWIQAGYKWKTNLKICSEPQYQTGIRYIGYGCW